MCFQVIVHFCFHKDPSNSSTVYWKDPPVSLWVWNAAFAITILLCVCWAQSRIFCSLFYLSTLSQCLNFIGLQCMCYPLSLVQVFATTWTIAQQNPLSVEFFRQEYWGGSPPPSPVQGICLHLFRPVTCNLFHGLPCSSDGKESACNAEDLGLIPGLGRSSGEGNDNPLQYSCLENPTDRGLWQATVCGVTESWARLSG